MRTIAKAGTVVAATTIAFGMALPAVSANAAVATPASASCAQTTVAGTWNVTQQNLPPTDPFTFELAQSGSTVTGTAAYTDSGTTTTGTVAGTLNGSTFAADITWDNGAVGHYDATVTPGQMSGTGYDVSYPSYVVTWSATGSSGGCGAPVSKDQCKNGGWSSYGNPAANILAFKNQGDCVSYVASGGKSDAHSA